MPRGGSTARLWLAGCGLAALIAGAAAVADEFRPRGAAPASPASPVQLAPAQKALPGADGAALRTVIVEWKIKKGREQEFLDYWSKRSTIPDRSGLVSEFLNVVEPAEQWPWMSWSTPVVRPDVTVFYNIGLWRDASSFQDQIGKFIDPNRPLLDFEAERRNRIVLGAQRWRAGQTALPSKDSDATQ